MSERLALQRMHEHLSAWKAVDDKREVFLHCYSLMTANMYAGIEQGKFQDNGWVAQLLNRFADYYFSALEQWEEEPSTAPMVWQFAHEHTRVRDSSVLQHLLLGVNAHINYDLVLTVTELLDPDWSEMTDAQRDRRYEDYCLVNAVIADSIDAVQDEVIAQAMPMSGLIDKLLGRLDENLISRFISNWRDKTWYSAARLLETTDPDARKVIIAQVEYDALTMARQLGGGRSSEIISEAKE
jgi:hypothetical protein